MFLHVGADVVVSLKRVVGIFDLKSSQMAEATREFLAMSHREQKVTDIAGGEAKSMVLTDSEIYLSPISSLTLMKRADFLSNNLMLDMEEASG
jgi:extracellular matrix regulatory protein B